MTFNIGSQHGSVINNVQGDQTIHGGQTAIIGSPFAALDVVQGLRRDIEAAMVPDQTKTDARKELDDIERQLRRPEPDKATIGASLLRVTKVLTSAGALVTGGTALLNGITALATWLGRFGAAALQLAGRGVG